VIVGPRVGVPNATQMEKEAPTSTKPVVKSGVDGVAPVVVVTTLSRAGEETKREDLGTWVLAGDASGGGWRRRLRVSPTGPPAVARWHGGVAWWCGGIVVWRLRKKEKQK